MSQALRRVTMQLEGYEPKNSQSGHRARRNSSPNFYQKNNNLILIRYEKLEENNN